MNWLVTFLIFSITQALALFAIARERVLIGAAIYWLGFTLVFILAMRNAYLKRKLEKEIEFEKTKGDAWLAPLSRRVEWGVDNEIATRGAIFCVWQGVEIPQSWNVDGKEWVWFKNTREEAWPMEIRVEHGMRWWKGLAIYKLKEENLKSIVADKEVVANA